VTEDTRGTSTVIAVTEEMVEAWQSALLPTKGE
jgi:hypothetical protein